MTDNELREQLAEILGLLSIEPKLIDELLALIKQHTEKRAASELEAIRSAMTEFAKMGDREWFSIAGLKYINDRLNQLKKEK